MTHTQQNEPPPDTRFVPFKRFGEYTSRGIAVFPITRSKKPFAGSRGFLDATTFNDVCDNRARELGASAYIGIRTGRVNDLYVVDCDRKNGLDGVQSLISAGVPEQTFDNAISTPSGGLHLVFEYEAHEIQTRASVLPGVDVRGDRGYVAAYADAETYDTRRRAHMQPQLRELIHYIQDPQVTKRELGKLADQDAKIRRKWLEYRDTHESIDLSLVSRGLRNVSLFDEVRFWAYDNSPWYDSILRYARARNREFDVSLPDSDCRKMARSVANFMRDRYKSRYFGKSFNDAQRARGVRSGEVRRDNERDRDREIIWLELRGWKQREIAEALNVSQQFVSYVVKRDKENEIKRLVSELHRQGLSQRKIANELRITQSAVFRALKSMINNTSESR